jgi:peptidoglycan/LPS O-acetylase OafA/YrhL
LDGVRAIAITMVMLFHLSGYMRFPSVAHLGQTGVDLFFVLSGFLITGILLKAPQHDWHEVKVFYIRRTLRIFPLYYAVLILLPLLGLHAAPVFWVYLQNISIALNHQPAGPNHFWSLAVEEQFYLVWPFLVLFMPRRFLQPALITMIVLAFLSRIPIILLGYSPFFFTLCRIDALAVGGILALLLSSGRLHRLRIPLWIIAGLSSTIIAAETIASAHTEAGLWIEVTKYTAFAFLYAAGMGLLLISNSQPLKGVLGSKPMRFIGRISYGLYVFHPFVFYYTFVGFPHLPPLAVGVLAVAFSFACALISWHVMEKPLVGLKDKLAPERAKFPTAAPSMTAL